MKRAGVALLTVAILAAATPVLACPVCFGGSDSPQVRGMQAGILALLGVTVAILASFAGFFFIYLRRRMRLFEESSATIRQSAHGGSY